MATKLKLRATARFLASIFNGVGTSVRKDGLATYVDIDYTQFGTPIVGFDPTTKEILIYDTTTGSFNVTTLQTFITNSQNVRVITAAGDVTVAPTDALIILNKTTLQATNFLLPPAISKVGRVKIVNWKADAGAYTHTVTPTGSEVFNDGQTSWPITGPGASAVFDPIPTLGYAV